MAADAEVKLNFTASIEQARAAIAEVSAAMEKLQATGGVMRPEDAALMNEMQGQLAAYKARVDELDAAYRALQASGGEANTAALEQIKELQQEVETLTKQQNALVDKVVSLQVENNKLKGGVQEVGKETEKAGDGGVKVVRSMRGVVANFIRDLARGKLAVRELGVALKGLAYSTVVLGAIQLAMDGIIWAWEGIKSMFTESEEEMQAAEEAAKRAQEELDKAKGEAEKAAEEVQQLKKKLAEKEEAEALKETLAGITAEYVAQRDAANSTLAALKEQAQVKARERALEAAQRTGELDMELLNLEERFASGDVGKRDYIVQKADIEKRKRDEARVAAVDSAEIAKDAAEAERDRLRAELAESRKREASLLGELGKYSSPDESEIAAGEYNKTRMRRKDFEAQMDKARDDFYQKYGSLGEIDENGKFVYKRSFDEFLQENTGLMFSQDEFDEQLNHVNYLTGKVSELREREKTQKNAADAAAKGAKQYQEVARRLDEERKTAAGLEKTAKTAEDGARRANDALGATLRRTAMEGGQDDRLTDKRVQMQLAAVDRDEARKRKEAKKPAKVSGELKEAVKQIVKDAKTAYNTDDDRTDDVEVMRAVAELLRNNGSEMGGYKDGLKELLTVCSMLKVKGDSNSAELARLKTEIKSLKRRTSQQ